MDGLGSPLTAWGIPGFFILVLAGVVVYQNRKINQLYAEKDTLQERRLAEIASLTDKYNQSVGNFSQTVQLLTVKLKVK